MRIFFKKHFQKFVFILIFLISFRAFPQQFSVFLLGDAGKDTCSGELLQLLKKELDKNSESAVIFLGDNIYPQGFLEKNNGNHDIEKKCMLSQLNILNEHNGSAFFIPGNHDWRLGKLNGKKAVMQQCNFVNSWCVNNSKLKNKSADIFCPSGGEPGPVSVLLTPKLRLVMIDTQWWLQPFEANKFEKNLFLMRLDSVLNLASRNGERILIAGHHPLFSNGRHAKKRTVSQFLINYTPLHIFGLLGLNRLLTQDLVHPRYRHMRKSLLQVFEKYPGVIYAAGHEHNLQLSSPSKRTVFKNFYKDIKASDDFFIVSGSASKVTKLSEQTYQPDFAFDKGKGFIRIDFLDQGNMIFSAYTPINGKLEKIYTKYYEAEQQTIFIKQ